MIKITLPDGHYYDEMLTAQGEQRPHYNAWWQWFRNTDQFSIRQKKAQAELLFHRIGITFNVYGEDEGTERLIPFDSVPRIIPAGEWQRIDRGIRQRVKALNAFLYDIYHEQNILRAGLIPAEQVLANEQYQPCMQGINLPNNTYAHITGVDTLKTGDSVIAGTAVGRVRVMTNSRGEKIESAGPSTPVEITGLADVPAAGDEFNAVEDEKLARELVEKRRQEAKEKEFSSYQKVTLDNLFEQIEEGETKELPIIVKADVQGSVEAVKQSLEKLSNAEVRVKVIHGAVGAVSKSDVMLAQACGAIIVGFNVRPDPVARDMAESEGVDMRMYRVIYDAIEEISSAMKGMLAPKTREVELGRAEVREVFKITGVGTVAGCYVLEGKITRNAEIRIVRDGIIIADEHLTSLKRFKDDVKEVAKGYECGMGIEKFTL